MSKPAYVRVCESGCGSFAGGWQELQATTVCVVDGKVQYLCDQCARYAPGVWAVPLDHIWATPIDDRQKGD